MRIVVTAVAAVVLACVATFGIYAAGKPSEARITQPLVVYGTR